MGRIVLLGLLVCGCVWSLQGSREISSRPPRQTGSEPPADWPHRVEGFGLTAEKAREDAWRRAAVKVGEFLDRHLPGPAKKIPGVDFVRKNLKKGENSGPDLLLKPGVAKRWVVFLKEPGQDLYRWYEANQRAGRSKFRLLFVAKVLGGALLILLVLAGLGRWFGRQKGRERKP